MATKRKQFAKWSRDAANPYVEFANGEKRTFLINTLSEEIRAQLQWYGLKQKLADSGSDADTVDEFADAVVGTWEQLYSGVFNKAAGGGDGREIIAEAIARITGRDEAAVSAAIDKHGLDFFRKRTDVKKAVAEIRAERAASLADPAESLDDLMD